MSYGGFLIVTHWLLCNFDLRKKSTDKLYRLCSVLNATRPSLVLKTLIDHIVFLYFSDRRNMTKTRRRRGGGIGVLDCSGERQDSKSRSWTSKTCGASNNNGDDKSPEAINGQYSIPNDALVIRWSDDLQFLNDPKRPVGDTFYRWAEHLVNPVARCHKNSCSGRMLLKEGQGPGLVPTEGIFVLLYMDVNWKMLEAMQAQSGQVRARRQYKSLRKFRENAELVFNWWGRQ